MVVRHLQASSREGLLPYPFLEGAGGSVVMTGRQLFTGTAGCESLIVDSWWVKGGE